MTWVCAPYMVVEVAVVLESLTASRKVACVAVWFMRLSVPLGLGEISEPLPTDAAGIQLWCNMLRCCVRVEFSAGPKSSTAPSLRTGDCRYRAAGALGRAGRQPPL